jgi:archaemetzincin
VKVDITVLGEAPPGLVDGVRERLPPPLRPGIVRRCEPPLGHCYDRHRAQLDAACTLEQLREAGDGAVALGVTGVDLFLPVLTFVFGASALGGRRSVVSWARLRPPEDGQVASQVLVRRLCTEAAHELGHALGLVHCVVPDCAMHRSLTPEAVDLKQATYCPSCLADLSGRT